jgi:hypothetical protein
LGELDDRDVDAADLDIRGWEVIAADGERMGIVDELLIDTGTGRVRYLDVDLDDDLVEVATRAAGTSQAQAPSQKIERQTGLGSRDVEGGARHVLLPIGRTRVDDRAEQVFLEGMGSREAAALPEYRPGASFPALERALAERFGAAAGAATAAEERFWRGGGAADTGTAPPEPGTTPAELAADEVTPEPGGSRRGTT